MSPFGTRLSRALGAAALAAGVTVTVVGTATQPLARADEEALDHDHGSHLHGDPIEAAAAWSAAGEPIAAVTPMASAWCGNGGAADDLANEVAQAGPKWHVVVAIPSDVRNHPNYANVGKGRLADHAFQSVKTLETYYRARVGTGDVGQAPSAWTLRFDYGTSCGPAFPDISFYNLPNSQAFYTNDPFSGVVAALDASNLYERSNKRYLIHYAGRSMYCGQSYIYAPTDNTGGAKYSLTYNLQNLATGAGVTPLCDWTTDAHEIGHSMGAATGGPNNNDGAHTWDCANDVMSYGGPTCGDGQLYYDWRENNYFNHTGTWNDTDRSAFWCKAATC